MSSINISHDYLLQFGGAERVVASWAHSMPASSIHTIAYDQDSTFDIFSHREVSSILRKRAVTQNIEWALPVLPSIAARVQVPEADIHLISTSGWAHQFKFVGKTIAYVHSPARWLYAAEDYRLKLGRAAKVGLRLSAPHLRRSDQTAMQRMSAVAANSRVSQQRIKDAYGIEAPIIHPPVSAPSQQFQSVPVPFDRYSLVVSRNRGYKNTRLAIAASLMAGFPCVVVGSGSQAYSDADSGVHGAGRVTDAQLQWLYRNASVVIGSAHEDFGLTVLEANLAGTPSAAIPVGGYLETVNEGQSGSLAQDESQSSLAEAILRAVIMDREGVVKWAESFSHEHHASRLLDFARSIS